MIWGIHMSRAVYVVAALGIADLLAGGPMTAAQLAQATQTHELSLYRVLRLLASLGVLTEHEHQSFSLTIVGERLRTTSRPLGGPGRCWRTPSVARPLVDPNYLVTIETWSARSPPCVP
jgi:Dimerisation domain